ncbi:MAG: M20 family metallopeptidase [Gammaproteobacteria bacterium]|nr:M20 family metallopeptidase [Gammaproteobacteria bacterium]MDH4315725.1 M20 family metallopeptidase [Gammaproteobacteria bacterium]MDH5213441.1 M20 family metallopeptidase [Gammaproteobacteria bacterium]
MPGPQAAQIKEYVGKQREPLIDVLRRMVESESPSSNPDSHRQIFSVIAGELQALDFDVTAVGSDAAGRHIYARPRTRKKGAPRQLLVGHYDTVWPLGTVNTRPFTVDGNIARGPGVFDMKGGLAQMLIALKCLRELRLQPTLLPLILINSDEEIGSRDSTRYIRSLARISDRAFVLEPAMDEEGIIKTERKGVGRFTVTAFGKAAHAGLEPGAGASAILELSHVIQSLFALNDEDRGVTVNVGTVDGGLHPNVIAPHSRAVIDVRVPTVDDGKRLEKAIHSITPVTPGVRLQIEGAIGRPSMEQTPRNRALWQQALALGATLGIDLKQGRAGGASDGNTTSQYTATLDGLGPVGHGAHAEREFLYLDRTLERAALLALLLMSPRIEADARQETS